MFVRSLLLFIVASGGIFVAANSNSTSGSVCDSLYGGKIANESVVITEPRDVRIVSFKDFFYEGSVTQTLVSKIPFDLDSFLPPPSIPNREADFSSLVSVLLYTGMASEPRTTSPLDDYRNVTSSLNLKAFAWNSSHMNITVPYLDPENGRDESGAKLLIILNAAAFNCGEASLNSSFDVGFNYTIDINALDSTVPFSIQRNVRYAAIGAATVNALLGSPTMIAYQLRLTTIHSLSKCYYPPFKELDVMISPTGFSIGDDASKFYRGAVIGNFFLFVGISSLMFCIAGILVAVRRWKKAKPKHTDGTISSEYADALATLHLPSLLIVPIALGFQGSVATSMSLFLHSLDGVDLALAVVGGLICASLLAYLFALSTPIVFPLVLRRRTAKDSLSFRALVEIVPALPPSTESRNKSRVPPDSKSPLTIAKEWLQSKMRSGVHWKSPTPRAAMWKRRYLFFYLESRVAAWASVEFLISFLFGLLDGIRINSRLLCLLFSGVATTLVVILLLACAYTRPSFTPMHQRFIVVVNFLALCSCVSVVIGLVVGDNGFNDGSLFLSLLVWVLGIAKCLLELWNLLTWIKDSGITSEKMVESIQRTFLPRFEDLEDLQVQVQELQNSAPDVVSKNEVNSVADRNPLGNQESPRNDFPRDEAEQPLLGLAALQRPAPEKSQVSDLPKADSKDKPEKTNPLQRQEKFQPRDGGMDSLPANAPDHNSDFDDLSSSEDLEEDDTL